MKAPEMGFSAPYFRDRKPAQRAKVSGPVLVSDRPRS